MAPKSDPDLRRTIRWPLALTRGGMLAEQVVRAWWPLWSVAFVGLSFLMLGVQDLVAVEWVWAAGALLTVMALWSIVRGVRLFSWPSREDAILRLDRSLKGNPIQAATDSPAIGAGDPASMAVWQAHQKRMRARLVGAKPVEPDLRVAKADPYALRLTAVLALAVAFLFGSFVRVQSVTTMGAGGPDLMQGPSWEGWMIPPSYTRLPTVYLNDITSGTLDAPEGSQISLRMYGEVGSLSVTQDLTGNPAPAGKNVDTAQDITISQAGTLSIEGPGGRAWQVAMIPDTTPIIERTGEIEVAYDGAAQIPFSVRDDFDVVGGKALISLDLDAVDRRYGRAREPEVRDVIDVPLPLPISGNRSEFSEALGGNFSLHPWANLPVRLELSIEDARGQIARTLPEPIALPGRRFFDPMAAAIIEQRQALLWNRENAGDIAQTIRAISNRPDDVFRKKVPHQRLLKVLRELETLASLGLNDEQQAEIAQSLWDLALELEEGDLKDALERLQRAQERLQEAMKNGASDQEIAELMQELREATDDYMRQLSQQQKQDQDPSQGEPQNSVEMSQDDLQRMMDRIQELMEQGRMAEAAEALQQLQEMMENMQVTQGEGGQSPGEQAMDQLSETLRDQQELSDEAFRDLQEQFNPGSRPQGQPQPGDQQGQGEPDDQQPGQGQNSERGEGAGQGQEGLEQNLADRQRALREELNRQRRNLPGQGTEAGEQSAQSLDDADRAMDGAEQALRDGDMSEAIDKQSEAMEALRDGMRSLGEAMAEQRQQQQGQQGFAEGGTPSDQRDPLGRAQNGTDGHSDTDQNMLPGEEDLRRADELSDEIRRRLGEVERPDIERGYLDRLLDRF
ncbi:TIGR02302 family protein [Pelagimonas varians]|uniref:TIGR02302 family protein n=1 Tax=Pelagimonas varians TaxID=696760 RepID=A0A238KJ47_9RHOB|nr:TIGR02302 family protein [Pelagimonas varians]PYG29559.1 uncharacterized protein (TIGR02302 family) [Pelagimonas varians]SMX42803.1 hypothetical protein PEV8663_02481 [Pelagimonas varians]